MLDGAMGTMIQRYKLTEADFRGERFAAHPKDQRGNSDVLILTRPDVISAIHHEYLAAGADIIETNTFSSTAIAQSDYALEPYVYELNVEGARLAKAAAVEWTKKTPEQPRFAAGSMGPMNRTLSISPDVNDPAFRGMTFDQAREAYEEQVRGLIDGGADLLLLETIFDTLNAKAAHRRDRERLRGEGRPPAADDLGDDHRQAAAARSRARRSTPSTCRSATRGRSASASTARSARATCARTSPSSREMAECYVSVYPNAGLPNAFGQYDELPDETGALLRDFVASGFANIVGGCCGTTPDHIAAVRKAVEGLAPRQLPAELVADCRRPSLQTRLAAPVHYSQFSGLETLTIRPDSNFQMIGERTNVTGSASFARLIKSGNYAEAAHVAAEQVRGGANLIDVNMDEGMLDSEQAMTTFLNYIATEPEIARVPVVVDSSKWSVIEAGLKCVQGKGVVNSISLKEGEADFLHKAKLVKRYGAGVVVMAFDETGQADTIERKVEICQRAYKLLVEQAGFDPADIIFDPNILAIATGLEEHNDYAVNFIEATRIIKATCPGVKISGGVSNLSFSFRGNDVVREAMHSAFLFHAIKAGMDMGIVNAGQLVVYEDIRQDAARARRGRDLQPPARRHRAAGAVRRHGEGRRQEARGRSRVARGAGRAASQLRAGARRRRLHRGRHRGSAPEVRAAARDHRRAADGRHEDRRRPVRRRQDVPAAGGQERARDEEGRRLPAALHGGGEAAVRVAVRAGPHRDGDRQGRRPRHRQEHRRRGARLQQLRGHRPRRDGPGREDPRRGDRAEGRHRRAERADHAVARRDGRRSRARWSGAA